jgi:ankyrin repeat protein
VVSESEDDVLSRLRGPETFSAMELVDALCAASDSGSARVVEALLDLGASVNQPSAAQTDWNALMWAVAAARADVVRVLLARGADPNSRDAADFTALFTAIDVEVDAAQHEMREATTDMSGVLVEYGADVNAPNDRGETPLDLAIVRGHRAAETLLRERSARRGTLLR